MIKNIIFDLGGVLLEIYPERTINTFKSLGFKDNAASDAFFRTQNIFSHMEIIPKSTAFFCAAMNSQFTVSLPESRIIELWNLLLGDFISETVDFVKSLKPNYRLFLLSNTNDIHFEVYTKQFYEKFDYKLSDLFEKVYFSHEIGLRKPNPSIFELVLNENKLNAEETLFFDDMPDNRAAAERLGIKTIAFKTNDRVSVLPEITQSIVL
jgi:putative hydrolase of the HAD superfamily